MAIALLRGSKRFSVITLSNLGVQVISLIFFTIIVRLFESHVIGEYLIYLSYVSIVVIVSTGFYEQALFIDSKDRRQPYILIAALCLAMFSALLAYIPFRIIMPDYAIFVSISVLAGAIRVIARSYGIVNGRLSHIAIWDLVLSPAFPLCLMFGEYFFGKDSSLFLISVNSLISFFTSVLLLFYVASLNRLKLKYGLKNSLIFPLLILKRYSKLPKFKMPSEMIGILTLRLPLFVIDNFFTAMLAAFYGVAFRIAITPVSVIVGTVAQMFLHQVRSNRANNLNTYDSFISYTKFLFILSIISVVAILTLSDWIIIQLFTDEYIEVAHILKLLSPYIAMQILVSPLMGTFVVFEKTKKLLLIRITLLIMTFLGYMVAVVLEDIDYGFLLFSLSSVSVYGYAYLSMHKYFKHEVHLNRVILK